LGIDTRALVERAASIRPVLERNAEKTDSLRRLADENVQALKHTGLCRLMVPARFGGHQTSVRTYIDVMAELGRGCGSTSWEGAVGHRAEHHAFDVGRGDPCVAPTAAS
jgi:alkylation response protein AidB-like acyl-CoA dehydrogenase